MEAGCRVGCQPAIPHDEAGWQPTQRQSTGSKPQSVSAPAADHLSADARSRREILSRCD